MVTFLLKFLFIKVDYSIFVLLLLFVFLLFLSVSVLDSEFEYLSSMLSYLLLLINKKLIFYVSLKFYVSETILGEISLNISSLIVCSIVYGFYLYWY